MQPTLTHTYSPGDKVIYNDRLVTIDRLSKLAPDIVVVRWTPAGESQPITRAVRVRELTPAVVATAESDTVGAQRAAPVEGEVVGAQRAAPSADEVLSPALERAINAAIDTPVIEVETLVQVFYPTSLKALADHDAELAARCNAGWNILNLSVIPGDMVDVTTIIRVVTLQRVKPADPVEPAHAAAHVANVVYASESVEPDPLEGLPIAQAIRQHGAQAVIDAMNEQARAAGRAAFNARLQHGRIYTRLPSLPASL